MQEDAEAEARKKQRVERDDMDACATLASDCSEEEEHSINESDDDSEMEIEAEQPQHVSVAGQRQSTKGHDSTPVVLSISCVSRLINIGTSFFTQEQRPRRPNHRNCHTQTPLDCDRFR